MRERGDVPPKTVGVDLRAEGVAVEYLDNRTTLYRGVPRPVAESVTIPPETEIHLLITDPSETEGVMLYVNDLKTEDAILEETGVGRVVLPSGTETEPFPGVTVGRRPDDRTTIAVDLDVTRGRVFVFAEDDWTDRRYEFVPPEQVPNDPDRSSADTPTTDAAPTSGGDSTVTDSTDEANDTKRGDDTAQTDERETDDEETGWINDPAVTEEDG